MPQYGRVRPSVGGSVPVREGVPQCGRVRPTEGECAQFGVYVPLWEGVPQCGRVCPSEGGYLPVRVGCVPL